MYIRPTDSTKIKRFLDREDGAVTVDWVVLTAAIVGLGLASYGVVAGGVSDLSGDIDAELEGDVIQTAFASGGSGTSSLSDLNMRVFNDVQRDEAAASMRDYDDATVNGIITHLEIAIENSEPDATGYDAMNDVLTIARYEKELRAAEG